LLEASNTLGEHQLFDNVDAMPFAFLEPDFISGVTQVTALESVERSKDLRLEPVAVEGAVARTDANCLGSSLADDRVSNIRLRGGNLSFEFEASQGGMLIVNQTFQNGWEGWINGVSTPVYAVNYRWMGLHLPCPGKYEIELRYFPIGLRAGLIITLSTLALVFAISLSVMARSRHNKSNSPLRRERL